MARPRQPVDLVVHKGKAHMTKTQIEERKKAEVKAPSNAIVPPSYLTGTQKKKFSLISQQLIDIGIMSNLDCDSLARYIQSESKYVKYDKLLTTTLNKASSADKAYVLIVYIEKLENLRDKAFKQCRAAASDFGLTISSRCKLTIPQKEKQHDPHASMFGDEETG